MNVSTTRIRVALAGAALALAAAAPLGAQAWAYPSFQMPRVTPREFNFALADADNAGTTLLFQWREGQGQRSQLSLDFGVADMDGGPNANDMQVILVGGQFARQLTTARADMPFDLLLTVGANGAFGDGPDLLRIPVGLSAGHRFPLEGGYAITPYAHPRLVIAHCNCGTNDDTDLGIDFDLGGEFEFNPAFALRLSATLGSDTFGSDDSFGVSLAWHPGRRR